MPTKSVAIVTGASRGIGRATTIRVARDFQAVVLGRGGKTIASIRKPLSESNVACCIYGRRVVRSIRSIRRKAVRWAFGVSGLRTQKDSRWKGGHFFPGENPNDTAAIVRRFLSA